MIVQAMVRNNICLNAHPLGCKRLVREQVEYIKAQTPIQGARNVLIVGSSTGYGLASRIAAAFGMQAHTLGVAFERPAQGKRTASAGWYANKAFEEEASATAQRHDTIIADAFSHETKEQVIDHIRNTMGKIDLFIYSLASGVRIDPDTGERYTSVLKPIGTSYAATSIDSNGTLREVQVDAANEDEIAHTVKVMGGEDWQLWTQAMLAADVLEEGAQVIAYSYIGPELTRPLYREGTIGRAKEDLERTADELHSQLQEKVQGSAYVSVNKAVVTRASAVIPVVPLYLSILFRVMKEMSLHEGCIEQMWRLYRDRLYSSGTPSTDAERRIRIDDWEMRDDVQEAVREGWAKVTEENLTDLADVDQFKHDFFTIHGFGYEAIDYSQDVEV